MLELSIIIVTYNNENEIGNCIESITRTLNNSSYEIISVDNNSKDNTIQKITGYKVKIFRNNSNEGFTKAVNTGFKHASGKNIFLLNPDTVMNQNSIQILEEFLNENSDYGACAPKLLNDDNSIQYSIRNFPDYLSMFFEFSLLSSIFPRSHFFGKWKMKYFDYDSDADVNQPMAAALMIKRAVLDKTGMMDETFRMFFNDVDLCKRIIDSGYKIRYLMESEIIHKKGTSVLRDRKNMIQIWGRDCVQYFKKHHNNYILIILLKFNLKISEFIRILMLGYRKI